MENPKIRFKGFTKDWEQRKLIDYLEVSSEKNRDNRFTKDDVLSVSGEYGIVNQIEFQGRSFAGASVSNYGVVENGDVVYTKSPLKSNPYGIIKTNKGIPGIVSTLYAVYKPKEITDSKFVQIYFELDSRMNSYMHPLVNKGAKNDMKVSAENALKGMVSFPKKDEQEMISLYFSNLDHLITLHQRKCEQTKNLKKYMLQKMFPQNGAKVPEIRFNGFTHDWEQRKFSDIASRESVSRESSYDLPSLEYEDVIAEEGRLNKDISLKENIKKGIVFDGSQVLYGKLRPYLHNWLNPDFSGVAVGDWWVLKPNNADKSFIYRLIQTQRFDDIANQSAGSKMPRADWNLVSNTEFAVPVSQEEQEKIGEYFSSLDHLITLHQRKCEQTKNLKKYMLQKMFPQNGSKVPEIRFKGFTDEWEQRKLIEVCDYVDYRGKTPTKTEDGIFLVTAKNVKDGFIDYETSKEYISENAYEEVMRRGKPEIGDVLITTEAPCGNVAQVNKADIALAQRIIKYRGHIGVVDNTYLKHYLLSPEFQKILNAKSSGGTVQGIKGSILHQQKIIYPSYEEQKKIGQHMDSLDNLITLHQHKCEELKKLKKFMLQNMFI